ncbi:MAG TPA: phenylalanine--tRNA ligase subunit alpha [Gemmatimonadaceae bacterium]|nr:phenylalanine--tRNA ligase subunit alpha [Gemmatimonadaceae bacterium]
MDLVKAAEQLEREGLDRISAAHTRDELEAARTALLGRKKGRLTALLAELPKLSAEDKRAAGAALNKVKLLLEGKLGEREAELTAAARQGDALLDVTMPARQRWRGAKHPVTIIIEEIEQIFREIGFTVALGPEAETEWHNFTALNFPPDHPAMDMHDTLYLGDDVLLRTHTSPVQIRTLQTYGAPARIIVPGNVYRRDFFDASHAPMFAQIEGLAVDEGVSFVDLKATLTHFARQLFGDTKTRFRPSYFPFTEPSAEMDVQCTICRGFGCGTCKGSGWMEILGSGMVHPAVLTASGVDAERYTGWAFGMGPARMALARYGIPDIRTLYDSDVRFLQQFSR